MNQGETRQKSRRELLLILLILPFGILCMFMAGQIAIRLTPTWALPANMLSNLDPNAFFAGLERREFLQPLDPGILTQPAWDTLFLTPNAVIPTREIEESATPVPVRTQVPPPEIVTPGVSPTPTATIGVPVIVVPTTGSQIANLGITKSDGSDFYMPGATIRYTIVVTNSGPDGASKFHIRDNVPAIISGVTVNCAPSSNCGTNRSNGNTILFENASLSANAQLSLTISGLVSSSAQGNLSNTARVVIPSGTLTDPNPSNNSFTDTDRLPDIDLQITKTDGGASFGPSGTVPYTVTVTNNSAFDLTGITIADAKPAQITTWTWTCVPANPGCTGMANSSADFTDTINLTAGGSQVYSVTANITGNPGFANITNTVTVAAPAGFVDAVPSNNTATETTPPSLDLVITKTDNNAIYTPGDTLTYTVRVTNNGAFDLTGITVTDRVPTLFTAWSWTCAPDPGPPGASCTAGPSSTDINDTAVTLPVGGSVTYTINATVNDYAAGPLENTASVSLPTGLVDTVPGDNSATDTNANFNGEPEIGPPDGNWIVTPEGSSRIYFFAPAIVADGDLGTPDFVYYERLATPTSVDLDWVQVEISADGSTWYQVFYWGDSNPGIPDTNTNMDYVNRINDLCTFEEDNCSIPLDRMYNNTGVTIDVDGLVPAGSYPWIRITSPISPGGDGADTDAIQPYYP